jgi:hypothetical protein
MSAPETTPKLDLAAARERLRTHRSILEPLTPEQRARWRQESEAAEEECGGMFLQPDGWRPIATAPRDGSWCEVRTIERGDAYRMRWEPSFTSWVGDRLERTGCWTDDDGWLQPDEVDAWRSCP